MAVYSTNQNRHFFVIKNFLGANKIGELKALGDFTMGNTLDKEVYFASLGPGGPIRSDLICSKNVTYAKITTADKLKIALKKATVSLDPDINGGKPVSGQDYILKIVINNYVSPDNGSATIKYGAVHAYADMTPEVFYTKLKESLEMNFSREVAPLFEFTSDANGVTITEVPQPWYLGTMKQDTVHFKVYGDFITFQGSEVSWAKHEKDGSVLLENSGKFLENGTSLADMEYFFMGERGNQYGGMGFPNIIPTELLVDPDKKYDVLDIHYSFRDAGVNSYKSEKDIILVAESGSAHLDTIKTELEKLDIKVTK